MTIVVVDTSILLEILDVPGKARNPEKIMADLEALVSQLDAELLLPLVALVETGNHIAPVDDGNLRYQKGRKLIQIVQQALRDEAPWKLVPFPERDDLDGLLAKFEDHLTSGLGFADAAIVAIWEQQRTRWPSRRVRIWSLDRHLSSYDHGP